MPASLMSALLPAPSMVTAIPEFAAPSQQLAQRGGVARGDEPLRRTADTELAVSRERLARRARRGSVSSQSPADTLYLQGAEQSRCQLVEAAEGEDEEHVAGAR